MLTISRAVRSVKSFVQLLTESVVPTLIAKDGEVKAGAAFSVCPDPSSPRASTRVEASEEELGDILAALKEFDPNRRRSTFDIVSSSLKIEDVEEEVNGETVITGQVVSFDYSDRKHARRVSVPTKEWGTFLSFLGEVRSDLHANGDQLLSDLVKIQADEDKVRADREARKAEKAAKKGVPVKL